MSTPSPGASRAMRAPAPYVTRPSLKHACRPQMSVSLLPGIMSAAMVRVKKVIVTWTPCTSVCRSFAMLLTATVMLLAA